MKTNLAIIAFCLLLTFMAFGQQPETGDTAAPVQEVYIPSDLPGCMAQLDSMLNDEDKAWLRENGATAAHFGLGMWLRNNWGLWHGSPLQTYFRNNGIQHPDTMSSIILDCYVLHLKGEEVDYEHMIGEARRVEEQWRKDMEEWKENREQGQNKDIPSAPWFALFHGDRINDHHTTLAKKKATVKGDLQS